MLVPQLALIRAGEGKLKESNVRLENHKMKDAQHWAVEIILYVLIIER